MSLSPDGARLVTGGLDRYGDAATGVECRSSVQVLAVADGEVVRTLQDAIAGSVDVRWSPDGKSIASCVSRELRLWSASTGQVLWRRDAHDLGAADCFGFSSDSRLLLTRARQSYAVEVLETATGRHVTELGDKLTLAARFTGARAVWLLNIGDKVEIRSVPTGERLAMASTDPEARWQVFSDDGRVVATTRREEGDIHLWQAPAVP